MQINKTLILLLLVSIMLISCSGLKRPAIGPDNMILVLADQIIWDTYKPQLEEIFNDPIYTPRKENRFNLKRVSLSEFKEGSAKYKNVILLTNVDKKSEESEFIKKFFTPSIIDGVRNGDYYYVTKDDIWSLKQKVVFFMDSENLHLAGYLNEYSSKLFGIFDDRMIKKVKDRLFDDFNNKKAQKYTRDNYNIDLFVPHEFVIINEGQGKDKFIRYRRHLPDRWLTVLRTEYNNEISFQENIIQARDRIGAQFGDSVKVNREILSFEPDTTFVNDGLKAEGIWEYSEGGGPFFSHAFLKNGSFYLVDGCVFAPSKDKYPYIIQLELMAESVKFLELEDE